MLHDCSAPFHSPKLAHRVVPTIIGVATALLTTSASLAQCDVPPVPGLDIRDHAIPIARLGHHFMPNFGDGDSMTIPFLADQGTAMPFGSEGFHEMWYLSYSELPGVATGELFRRYSASFADHLDHPAALTGPHPLGFVQEFRHGYAFDRELPGTAPIERYVDSSRFDHRTWSPLAPSPGPAYTLDAVYSSAAGTPRYGYPRFGNLANEDAATAVPGPVLENSALRVSFNPVYGNAIKDIVFKSGQGDISFGTHNLGEMVQGTVRYVINRDTANEITVNPTQSGGIDTCNIGQTERYAGSPVLDDDFVGSAPQSFETWLKPMFFNHRQAGSNEFLPLLWKGEFRFTTTVGCRLGGILRDDVILMELEAHEGTADIGDRFQLNPTAWLQMEPFGDCRGQSAPEPRLIERDLASGQEVEHIGVCGEPRDLGGAAATNHAWIASRDDGSFAVALVRPSSDYDSAHSIRAWVRKGFSDLPVHTRIILENFTTHFDPETWQSEPAVMVAGSLNDVRARLDQIYAEMSAGTFSCQQ